MATRSRLDAGDRLPIGNALSSPNHDYVLRFQNDGNLVLSAPWGPIWSTKTTGKNLTNGVAIMQNDGNFVLYGPDGSVWDSDTHGSHCALIVQNDGNVVIQNRDGVLWSTKTANPTRPQHEEESDSEEAYCCTIYTYHDDGDTVSEETIYAKSYSSASIKCNQLRQRYLADAVQVGRGEC